MNDEVVAFLLGAFLAWCFFVGSPYPVRHDYVLKCSGTIIGDGECKGTWHHEHVITYAIYPERQTVVVNYSDGDTGTLEGCSVLDAKNWTCTDKDFIRSVYCQDGDCGDTTEALTEKRVSALRYYATRVLDLF
jgi:hypothetical protein